MKRTALLCMFLVAALCGCDDTKPEPPVSSLHGIGTEGTIVLCNILAGDWGEPTDPDCELAPPDEPDCDRLDPERETDEPEEEEEEKLFRFTMPDSNDVFFLCLPFDHATVDITGTLVQLGDMLIMDLVLRDEASPFWLPLHVFAMVHIQDHQMSVWFMDDGIIRQMLTDAPSLLRHEIRDERIIITASPEELQQFFVAYGPQLFLEDALVLERR